MQAKDIRYTIEEYENLPEGTRAELIDGVIYDMAPPMRIHQKILMQLSFAIQKYINENKGECEIYPAPFFVKLSESTVVEPDISIICDKDKLNNRGCFGSPDWIIEIVSINAVHDYLVKLNLYQSYGVKEYWIVDPKKQSVTVYHFGKNFEMMYYKFSDTIPVGIYKNNPTPLEINISELL